MKMRQFSRNHCNGLVCSSVRGNDHIVHGTAPNRMSSINLTTTFLRSSRRLKNASTHPWDNFPYLKHLRYVIGVQCCKKCSLISCSSLIDRGQVSEAYSKAVFPMRFSSSCVNARGWPDNISSSDRLGTLTSGCSGAEDSMKSRRVEALRPSAIAVPRMEW